MSQLSLDTLAGLSAPIVRPGYDPRAIGVGIVHLGIGAFYRAQSAEYTDDAIARNGGDWGICGVSLRSADVRDRLAPQDGLYTAVEKSPLGIRRRIIGSVREVLYLGDERARVQARLASAQTSIVSLTITEKGYCHDPATGRLNFAHPDIVHDLATPQAPISAVGLLVAALEARQRSHGKPMTVLCCDNLPHNGALVRGLVLAFGQARDGALAAWIARNATFPSTMVDRIVPATTDADIADNDAALGLHDAAPVMHEPFKQWAIEDDFAAGRPAWERVGAQLVTDVEPFEAMKLRLLNASHSAFAYLGFLAGHEYIYQVAAQEPFAHYMRA
ncbi:MAG: mannitol dehydrogenase family protein, partial [Betaproteobacteria bacterium]